MRNLKKLFAVGLTAAMTTAMSLSAFAAQDVTLHFKNAANWSDVGGWIYEGVGFTTQIMPQDKCPAYNTEKNRAIWPGAKLTKEADYDGWYSITVTVQDPSQGLIAIFNNLVADTKVDTASGGDESDQAYLDKADLVKDTSGKQQTANQLIPKNQFTSATGDYWCDFTGDTGAAAAKFLTEAPASYVKTASATTDTTAAAGSTTATTATANTSVKTGDSAAYAIVFTGIAAAAVFVASRRRVNE